jgi:hypothetical protein
LSGSLARSESIRPSRTAVVAARLRSRSSERASYIAASFTAPENEFLEADLVLAGLTVHNPNLLFELGIRIAEDKPVVLVRAKGTGRIRDIDQVLRIEDYRPNLWPATVAEGTPET